LNEGKVVGREPFVARGYPTTLLDPIEEPLDLIATAVEIRAEAYRTAAIAFRRGCWPARPSTRHARLWQMPIFWI